MVSLSDWDKKKTSDITSKSGSPTISNGIAVSVRIDAGSTDSTGTGRCQIDTSDTSISSKDDIVFVDPADDSPLTYYFERFDTTNQVYSGWVFFSSLDRDGSTQFKILFGNGPSGGNEESARTTVFSGVSDLVHRPFLGASSGTIVDDSGNNYDAVDTRIGSYENTANDFIGKAVFLDGSGDFIDFGDTASKIMPSHLNSTNNLMILTHQKRTGSGSGSARIYQNDGQDGGNPWLKGGDSNSDGTDEHSHQGVTGNDFNLNNSEAVAGGYEGSTGNNFLYQDASTKFTASGTAPAPNNVDQPTVIGANSEKVVNLYEGYVDEVQVFDQYRGDEFIETWQEATPGAGETLFSWNSSSLIATTVTASPTLATGTPITAQTTGILGNWRAFKDARITERTQVKVEGGHAQKWEIDASKTTAERAVYRADQTLDPDMSTAFGTTSGGFTQGTIGWHIRIDDTAILRSTDALQLRVGSSPGDYAVWTLDRSELGPNGEYKYLTFSHDEYDSIVGTPDWTNVDFFELTLFEKSGNTTDTFIYVDYLTVSDRDDLGATGIGDRRSSKKQIRSGD